MRETTMALMCSIGSIAMMSLIGIVSGCQQREHEGPARKTPTSQITTTTPAGATTMPVNQKFVTQRPRTNDAVAIIGPSKAATTQPVNKNVRGTVTFTTKEDGKVLVVADITGFEPNTKHGFHIHEKSDMSSPDLMSTGDHFNPGGHQHGSAEGATRHAGDFGNLIADSTGKAHLELLVSDISIATGKSNDVLGKPIIVHAKEDDLKSQPSGNSGARVAGGLIQSKKE